MELIGNLKKQVADAKDKQEAKEIIRQAGIVLDDEEMEMISGGKGNSTAKNLPINSTGRDPFIMPGLK